MRTSCFWLMMALGCLDQTLASAGEPTAADLIALVPVIQSSDPAVKSIELVGTLTIKDAGLVRVRSLYRAPDQYSLLVNDSTDGTPLVYVADRSLLFYDPIRSAVTCLKDCSERLTLEGNGKGARFGFEVGRTGKKGLEGDLLKLDGSSLFVASGVLGQRVVVEGNGRYRLVSSRDNGQTTVCSFDLFQPQPFEGLKVFEGASHEPVFSVDKLVVNGSLTNESFQFPDRDRLSKRIPVHELAGNFLPVGSEMLQLSKAIQTRFAIKHPGVREDQKPPGFEHQPWKAIQKHDQKASSTLRDLVPVDQRSTVDPKAKQATSSTGGTTSR